MKNSSKKKWFYVLGIFAFLLISFFVYKKIASADVAANKVAIKDVKIKSIYTGTTSFDENDGLDYSDSSAYSTLESYIPGNDSNKENRIVRSFDELVYNFEYRIQGKDEVSDYEERKVDIKVTFPEEIAKYVSFDKNELPGETSRTYTFEGINTYGVFNSSITLYVLGAPNGLKISPKFEIQESTNTEVDYLVNLGSVSFDTELINYEYNYDDQNKYNTKSTVMGFNNYMPTIVSSKTGELEISVSPQTIEGQTGSYNDFNGRYFTYVLGLNLVGDNTKGIKGLTMPNGEDITFDVTLSQSGNNNTNLFDNSWFRIYSNSGVANIGPVVVSLPYSAGGHSSNTIKYPGNVEISKNNDQLYSAKIKDYKITYQKATINADGSKVDNNKHFIGTYALSIFSPRTTEDGKNDIISFLDINNINAKDTNNNAYSTQKTSGSVTNKYYEYVDYSLTSGFYDDINNKLSKNANGLGSTSKGSLITYKTTFNYKKTLSNEGLKEIIKIDPNAYRVVPLGEEDIKISINGSEELKTSDFEVTYVSGNYNNTNYSLNTDFSRISEENKSITSNSCKSVNIGNLSNDQIMNLYGGPCIKVNDGVEQKFDKILNAKDNDKEIPITKIIIQTKKGVKLPDSVEINVEVGLRVRNISDLTQTYQAISVAMTADYDDILTYYAPRITNDINSITNPDNYTKTIYNKTSIKSLDSDSLWGDSLKIVNFTSREEVTVLNKNKDGSIKTRYNANSGETITYSIKTTIADNNMNVGADDVWYINNLKVTVQLQNGLVYVPDDSLGTPEVIKNDFYTTLIYTLPYTKPNQKIDDIKFKATISPSLNGSAIPLTVMSTVRAININNEEDLSLFDSLTGNFTIYATGIQNVIVSQKVGSEGSKVEKNSEFSYLLDIYNNTENDIDDYVIVDVLPYNNDKRGSEFSGSYKVKVDIPSSLGKAKVYCSTQTPSEVANEDFNNHNKFVECDVTDNFVDASAIRITDISINKYSYAESIKVSLKPSKNNYSNKYINSFVGGSQSKSQNESNSIDVSVISRSISGRAFIDVNENGIEDNSDTYYKDMPITLYKLDNENNLNEIDTTVTNADGYYEFKDLDSGRYKIRASYDNSLYDLTLRYATEDTTIDSDGYKVGDNIIEIGSKSTPNESSAIKLNNTITNVKNMNIGLISRKTFGFDISKYIIKIDLSYNNTFLTYNYENQNKVLLSLKNSMNATAKVYYGIKITNNSTTAGYVKLIDENIPFGLYFDENEEVNKDWFYYNGQLRSIALENDLISPGESRYLTIMLNMPNQQEAKTYVNTVTILDILAYEPEKLSADTDADSNMYEIGEEVRYAGVDWHVVNTENKDGGEQILTLLADSGTISSKMGHTSSRDEIYKWSTSKINQYLNNNYINNSLNLPILIDNTICDDASGLPIASYGGTLASEGKCQSGIYNDYKVRLLTEKEYNDILSKNLSDYSWLYGKEDFWLTNSVFVDQEHDSYGQIKDITNVKNLAKFISKLTTSIQNGYNSSNVSEWVTADTKKEVRPVIMISNRNIIAE